MAKCPTCQATLPADGGRFCGACGGSVSGPITVPDDPLIGRMLANRYRILRKLGAGGMGSVYAADQVSLKRPIAIKVLNPELFGEAEIVKRFSAEAEMAAKLSHPNTVNMYDFGVAEDGALYIAMELVEGRSLRSVLMSERVIAPARTIAIAEQVAASIADAHARGIVHRDLKPDNVMLSERAGRQDFVRVLDFGIAKLRDEREGGMTSIPKTQAGQLLGTPQYMSPEQILGDKVDGRTDVYAIGVMLYEMVCGRLPFEAHNVTAMLAMHLNERPPPPESKHEGLVLPPRLGALIQACMEKQAAARPPGMDVVRNELAAILAAPPPPLAWPPPSGAVVSPGYAPPPSASYPSPPPGYPSPPPGYPSPAPGYPSPPPSYGQPPPGYGQPPPGYGQPPPGYGQPPAGYYPPQPTPAPTPLPYGTPAIVPVPIAAPPRAGRSLLWLWILLAILVVGGGAGVTAYFLLRGGSGDTADTPDAYQEELGDDDDDQTRPETPPVEDYFKKKDDDSTGN